MKITFDYVMEKEEEDLLIKTLGCTSSDLAATLGLHARSALGEYVECYLGRKALTRGTDILEHRLVLLIQHAFENRIPGESKVSQLFQTTPAASRTLIRNVLAKYRNQLEMASTGSVKSVLESATWPGGGSTSYQVNAAPNLVELLNQRLTMEDAKLKPISRTADSAGVFDIDRYTYDKLCAAFKATKVSRR
jgi:hypothetical protein